MDGKKANNSELPGGYWAAEDAAPWGLIKTKEQFDYVKLYADNTYISFKLGNFEDCVGKYVCMGNYFGGAAFYFYATDNFDYLKKHPDVYGKDLSFSYGKYGRIEF